MDKNTYKERYYEMTRRHDKEIDELRKEYINSIKCANIGDIVTDKRGKSIIVDEVKYTLDDSYYPKPIYRGLWLTKKGLPNVKGEGTNIYHEYIVSVNGKNIKND